MLCEKAFCIRATGPVETPKGIEGFLIPYFQMVDVPITGEGGLEAQIFQDGQGLLAGGTKGEGEGQRCAAGINVHILLQLVQVIVKQSLVALDILPGQDTAAQAAAALFVEPVGVAPELYQGTGGQFADLPPV